MPYSDIVSVKKRMPAFFKNESSAYYAEYVENLDNADAEAKSIIDAFLGSKYATPFPEFGSTDPACPEIISTIASLLCRSQFLLDQYLGDGLNAEPKQSKVLYERAMILLKMLVSGDIVITGADLVPSENLGVYSSTYGRKSIIYNFNFKDEVECLSFELGRGNT